MVDLNASTSIGFVEVPGSELEERIGMSASTGWLIAARITAGNDEPGFGSSEVERVSG